MQNHTNRFRVLRRAVFLAFLPLSIMAKVHDGIVAVVDDAIITQAELDKTLEVAKQRATAAGMQLPSEAKMQKHVLDLMIYNKLQLALAHQHGVEVSDQELDQAITKIRKQQNLSEPDFELALKKDNLTKESFRKSIEEQLLVQKLVSAAVGRGITVTDDELERTWAKVSEDSLQYALSDYWYAVEDDSDHAALDDAKKKMDDFAADLAKGKLVTDLLAVPANQMIHKQAMPSRALSQMPKIFAEQVPALKLHQNTQTIQAANGYHVLVLEDKKGSINKAQLKQRLFMQKLEQKRQHWLQQLKAMAYVKINI